MLMCNFQLKFDIFFEKFDISYHDYFKDEHPYLKQFADDDFMEISDHNLKVTPLGRTFVRNIAMTFDAYLKEDNRPIFSRTI